MNENKKRSRGILEDELMLSDNNDSEDEVLEKQEKLTEIEPELECDGWDNDCKILTGARIFNRIVGCHLIPTCCNERFELKVKRKKELPPLLTSNLVDPDSLLHIQSYWNMSMPILCDNIEIITYPFKICIVKNLVENRDFLNRLRQELYKLNFNLRIMDLYEFFQSKDLKYLNFPEINVIYEFLKNDVMKWVSSITGYNFTHVSATCSLYSNTDYLLVHDDQREDRMMAFILYLTDDFGWSECDGGRLRLLDKNKQEQPQSVVRDIVPANNQFVFFPVTTDSYHQVEEITALDKYRLSINGWFHTREPPIFKIPPYETAPDSIYSNTYKLAKVIDIDLESWINDEYLEPKVIKSIQQYIEENSEISLKVFLKKECFAAILEQLKNPDIVWKKVGPPNRFSYDIIQTHQVPHVVERVLNLFQSTAMFRLLQQYTDLDLATGNASMKFELQRWTPGSYALLTDYDWKERNELDLILYLGCESPSEVVGARTQYVTMEDEVQNALITIEPDDNSLNIIYRDSARFTKYFSAQSRCHCFYVLICSYSE